MPPIRSYPAIKPIKTERSHEENQERAYIAASRRSDRSLEARIESARRASEIHKRRTGRSLRVTEADVVNEEMYEEEDDDLPMKYRRLTAHLNGHASDFNRRLAAFVTNQVAMRSALDQAMANNTQVPQQHWDHDSQSFQPNLFQWMQSQQQQQHDQTNQNFTTPLVSPPTAQRSPATTSLKQTSSPPSAFHNAAGACDPRSTMKTPPDHHRRASESSHVEPALSKQRVAPRSKTNTPLSISSPRSRPGSDSCGRPLAPAPIDTDNLQSPYNGPWSAPPQQPTFNHMQTGLSTHLPADAQMFFTQPFNAAEFNGRQSNFSEKPLFNDYNPEAYGGTFDGMNQTLALGAFDTTLDKQSDWLSPLSNDSLFQTPSAIENSGAVTSGQATPNEEFAAFIDSNAFEETSY